MKHPFTVLSLFLAMAVSLLGIVCAEESQTESKRPIQVALIVPSNDSQDAQTISAIGAKDPGIQITQLDGQQVRSGELDKFDVVILAGGSCDALMRSLAKDGIKKVKEFIKSGKGYMGLGGGAYFTLRADFLNAQTKSPKWERGVGDKIETTELGCTVFGEQFKGEHDVSYINGPVLNLNIDKRLPHVEVLAKYTTEFSENDVPEYVQIDSPAIMLSTYGKGTVLVFGVHPERTPALQGSAAFHTYGFTPVGRLSR